MPRPSQIIPFYSQPHVATYINDYSFYTEDVALQGPADEKPYDTLVVTGADKGIDNKFVKLTNYATKVELFGKGNFSKYGQASLQADTLLQTNEVNLWFMRVLPKNARYANIALVAHYRKPACTLPDWNPGDPVDPTDCEIMNVTGSVDTPILNPSGLKQLEVKYSVVNVTSKLPGAPDPINDTDIEEFLNGKGLDFKHILCRGPEYTDAEAACYGFTAAELQGFYSVPIFYIRATGRGKYGNKLSFRLQRDLEFELDNEVKSYGLGLIEREFITRAKNYFVGTLATSTKHDRSTLLEDVIGKYSPGSAPIYFKSYEDSLMELFDAYRSVVAYNATVVAENYPTNAVRREELSYAMNLVESLTENNYDNLDIFDPIFGYRINSKDIVMPYFADFGAKPGGYVKPTLEIDNYLPTMLESTDIHWDKFVDTSGEFLLLQEGDKILVKNFLGLGDGVAVGTEGSDRLHKLFTIRRIDITTDTTVTPEIITDITVEYNDGVWVGWNDHEFNGVNLTVDVGLSLAGGYDGEFEEIVAHKKNGFEWIGGEVVRPPNAAEMKLLLSREIVQALRGEKDKFILSPARINLDFIFDANYNVCADIEANFVNLDIKTRAMFANSNVLTNEEYRQLAILDTGYQFITNLGGVRGIANVSDLLNVKKALVELNNFRNKNGMLLSKEEGAGCELKLDCGLVGLSKTSEVSNELRDLLAVMSQFNGRNVTIDFGHYETLDPVSRRKIPVTVGYFLAERLIPHIARFGPNKPFVNTFAQIENMVRNSFKPELDLIDWDVKELLYRNRINYYLTMDEGNVVQRQTQSTCQKDPSALLEENNVRVLNILKKGLERACRSYLYEWNDPVVRKGYTDTQMEIYKPWIGTWVQHLNIRFEANEYEQERMIMHCYVDVSFRDIVKRITIEIDITRPLLGGE